MNNVKLKVTLKHKDLIYKYLLKRCVFYLDCFWNLHSFFCIKVTIDMYISTSSTSRLGV